MSGNFPIAPMFAAPMLAASLVLAGCSQSNAPSDAVEEVTEGLVEAASEELAEVVGDGPLADADIAEPAGPYAPRNECSQEENADAFLAALNAAVQMRDTDLLIALAAEDVKLGFGGEDGVDNLRTNLEGEESNLWEGLEELVTLGCAVNSQGGVTMPYYFAQDTVGDPYASMIVAGEDVPVRAAPSQQAEEVAQLSWVEVEIDYEEQSYVTAADGTEWTKVRIDIDSATDEERRSGYIQNESLRSVIDYRLIAASRNGRWRITAFLAGD